MAIEEIIGSFLAVSFVILIVVLSFIGWNRLLK